MARSRLIETNASGIYFFIYYPIVQKTRYLILSIIELILYVLVYLLDT